MIWVEFENKINLLSENKDKIRKRGNQHKIERNSITNGYLRFLAKNTEYDKIERVS